MKNQTRSNEPPKSRKVQETTLLGLTELPQCKGIIPLAIKGQKNPRRHANCPVHGNTGIETNWRPPTGLDQNMREFQCALGHAFYC